MTILIAFFLGVYILFQIDLVGAYLSRIYKFNYLYFGFVSPAFALSPLFLTDETTSPVMAAIYSGIIYLPETAIGIFVALKINPDCGTFGSYRDLVREFGFWLSYFSCWLQLIFFCALVFYLK